MDRRYDPHAIEEKWQRLWKERDAYRTPDESDKPKFYALDFFPYPSGDGLSVGHCRNYVPTDTVSRFKRMQGYNVLHPMGWDAFGLPAENYAIKMGVHPRVTTERNIANYHRQMDLDRPLLRLVARGHELLPRLLPLDPVVVPAAVRARAGVPGDRAAVVVPGGQDDPGQRAGARRQVLALRHRGDQEGPRAVVLPHHRLRAATAGRPGDGRLARADQAHADQLDRAQRGRRGRLRAAGPGREEGRDEKLTVFTTRPDTLFGATYMVLAPEHPLVDELTTEEQRAAVKAYQDQARRQSEIERMSTEKEKTGVFTGAYAVNPVNDAPVPIWTSDYVLMGYGTGAIMAVPAHDERDFAVRDEVRDPHRRGDRAGVRPAGHPDGGVHRRRRDGELGAVRRHGRAGRGVRGHRRLARARRARRARRSTSSCATGSSAGSATGARRSRWCTARSAARCRCPRKSCRCCCRTSRTSTRRTTAARRSRAPTDWVNTTCPGCGGPAQPRDRHHGHVRLLQLVPLPLRVSARRVGGLRPRQGRVLAAGRPVRGRRRARGDAPAVRALLLQGGAGRRLHQLRRALRSACATRA